MEEHLNSSPYQSLKSNRFAPAFMEFREHTLTPVLAGCRIRAWHYTRLTDGEVEAMRQELVPTSPGFLKRRLDGLVIDGLLTPGEADIIFAESPLHKQLENRAGRLWTAIVPLPRNNSGVKPLLESWGGESAYFWLSDQAVLAKLRTLGVPRIMEIETALTDHLNAFSVSETVLRAWARKSGAPVRPLGCDLAITDCLDSAKVLRVHTGGDSSFDSVAKTYPEGSRALADEEDSESNGQ